MGSIVKLDAFAWELKVATADHLIGDEHRAAFAARAASVRDEEIARQETRGVAPTVEQTVDGRKGAALASVRIGGHIRFDFSYLREMALFALEVLRGFAPVDSGAYRDAFFASVDGKQADPRTIPEWARVVVITNDVPYARKIQVGAKGFKVHAGLFDRAAKAVRSRYSNVTNVDVKFIKFAGGYVLRKPRKAGDTLSYPALQIATRL